MKLTCPPKRSPVLMLDSKLRKRESGLCHRVGPNGQSKVILDISERATVKKVIKEISQINTSKEVGG